MYFLFHIKSDFSLQQRKTARKYLLTSKETSHEINTKGYTFPPASDIDIGEPCFYFNIELKISRRLFLIFLSSMNIPNSCLITFEFILYAFAEM